MVMSDVTYVVVDVIIDNSKLEWFRLVLLWGFKVFGVIWIAFRSLFLAICGHKVGSLIALPSRTSIR